VVKVAACALLVAACSFTPGTVSDSTRDSASAIDPPWWDGAWGKRRRIVVTTGSVQPDKGYSGYTVRLAPLDAGCDVRVVVWSDSTWTVIPHHLVDCADLRFALPVALGDGAQWRDAFVYYDNPAATPTTLTPGEVYLFWDPATTDRSASYQRGRMDQWLSTGHDNSLAHDSGGYYRYDTTDDSQSSYRIAVDERDVLVEAEWFHTGCYTNNMQSSVCARGKIASGSGGSELSDHYYCSSRAQNPLCNNNDQGIYDGDIVKTDNEVIAVQRMADPPPLVPSQWRRQALAAFGVNPTQLRFWDADASWPALAAPPASALIASGEDATDYEGRGFAGVMTAQDVGRIRNLVIRRYVEPEPVVTVEDEALRPE
jgi:hypothetical protein